MSILDTITKAEKEAEEIIGKAKKQAAKEQSEALNRLRESIKSQNEQIRKDNNEALKQNEARLEKESKEYLNDYIKILEERKKAARKNLNGAADYIVKEVIKQCS